VAGATLVGVAVGEGVTVGAAVVVAAVVGAGVVVVATAVVGEGVVVVATAVGVAVAGAWVGVGVGSSSQPAARSVTSANARTAGNGFQRGIRSLPVRTVEERQSARQ
jgi:hypothetical protein